MNKIIINKPKLELAKILLQNKRHEIYSIIGDLKNLSDFIYRSGDLEVILEDVLSPVQIVEIRNRIYGLFIKIESGINIDLRMNFHFVTDEFAFKSIYSNIEMIDSLMSDLQFHEIQLIENAIDKIDRLNEKNYEKLIIEK